MKTLDIPLAPAEREAIEAAAARLRARFPVTDVVLYGSKARGDSDPESDIDLLVLTSRPLDAEEQQRIWSDLDDISLRFDVLLSPLTVEARSWREGVHSVLPIHTESRTGGRAICRS
jgi:predicted nucleotidyltransferase